MSIFLALRSIFVCHRLPFFIFHSVHNIFGYRRYGSVWCLNRTLLYHKMVTEQFTKIPQLIRQLAHRLLFSSIFVFHLTRRIYILKENLISFPLDTRRKLNVHKTFRRSPGRLLNVLWTFNLHPVPMGLLKYTIKLHFYHNALV